MALRDTWHRALVYFGLAEDPDYARHDVYEPDTAPHGQVYEAAGAAPPAPRRSAGSPSAAAARRDRRHLRRRRARRPRARASCSRCGNGGADVSGPPGDPRTASTTPRRSPTASSSAVPVILNLQTHRRRARQAADRLRLRPHLRARRRHADIELRRDRAEAADNACDRLVSDRIEQLLPQTPRKGAGPAERHSQTLTRVDASSPETTGLEPATSGVTVLSHGGRGRSEVGVLRIEANLHRWAMPALVTVRWCDLTRI